MTPAQVEVLLAFFYDPLAHEQPWSKHQHDFIGMCVGRGIFRMEGSRAVADPEALTPYIDRICAIPLPRLVAHWVCE